MKKILSFYTKVPLILRIAIGLVIGIALGLTVPNVAIITTLGSLFVGALKAIAPVLVFVLVISSLAGAGEGIGSRFRKVVFYYMLSTFLAAVVAVIGSYIFKVTIPLSESVEQSAPAGLMDVFSNLLNNMVTNPVTSIMNGNYVGILFWAVIFGLALRAANSSTKAVLNDLSAGVSKAVAWVIQLAPFGILGLVYSSVGEYGIEIFVSAQRSNESIHFQ